MCLRVRVPLRGILGRRVVPRRDVAPFFWESGFESCEGSELSNPGYRFRPFRSGLGRLALRIDSIKPPTTAPLFPVKRGSHAGRERSELAGPGQERGWTMAEFRMRFGKHRGRAISELDDGYLTWLSKLQLREPLATHVRRELDRRAAGQRSQSASGGHEEIMRTLERLCQSVDKLVQEIIGDPHEPSEV
jgi:hypothetical protein